MLKQMLKDGNELGNHSYDHQQLTKIDGKGAKKEVDDTNRNIKNICETATLSPDLRMVQSMIRGKVEQGMCQ